MRSRFVAPMCLSLMLGIAGPNAARAQESQSVTPVRSRIVQQLDDANVVALHNNVRPDLTAARDLGMVEDSLNLHLYLVLKRSPEQQVDLDTLVARQQQPTSPEYHKWLTPRQFGARFGASAEDIATITKWLGSRGFQVRGVMNNASFVDFAGTAAQVREAFHTQLHYFNIRGGKYPGLVTDPAIPAALSPVVAGIKGLNKIPYHANHTPIRQGSYDEKSHRWHSLPAAGETEAAPSFADGSGDFFVTPQDLYTIYNVNPTFASGELGVHGTVAVIEESDIVYGTVNGTTHVATGGDVATFRSLFGVPGTLNMHVYHGFGSVTCNDPGIDPNGNGEEGEAALDAEWANATAPSANLIFMSCDSTVDNGIFSSEAALIDNNLSDVMSMSYGESELFYTASDYSAQDTMYAQAASQGQSFFVSAGDSGSDGADQNTSGTATHGYNVSAFAAPTVTVAGGTDFSDLYDALKGGPAQSTYWSSSNSAKFGDALSYVPETAWNAGCASSILANYEGFSGAGYCALGPGSDPFINGSVVGGGGGISTHYAVPSYQTGISGYSGSQHSQPDISGFASVGPWGHALIFCDSHVAGSACTSSSTFGVAGGTSFVAPYLAGVAGLLVDYTGSRQGLLNPALYALGKAQYTGAATKTACYSNGQTSNTGVTTGLPAAACIFNDVTTSNNDVPCQAGSTKCFVNSGASYGMLSLNGSASLSVAYPSQPGFDQVTGIGTLNVNNLLTKWKTAFTSTTALTATPTSITSSQSTTLKATVTGGLPAGDTGPKPTLSGSINFAGNSGSLGSCTLSSGTCSLVVAGTKFSSGANSVTATFVNSNAYPTSTSSIVTVTVTGGSGSPAASLSATTLTFPTTPVGTQSAAQTVTLTNTGTAALNITGITLGGAHPSQFLTSNTCPASLAAGANCAIKARFHPTVAGTWGATISIADNATGSPQTIALSGTTLTAGPGVSLSATTITFPATAVGSQSAAQSVTLTNTGSATLTITSIVLGGTNKVDFLESNTCGTSVVGGGTCSIRARSHPVATGAQTATITITDNAPGSPQVITLHGTGQ